MGISQERKSPSRTEGSAVLEVLFTANVPLELALRGFLFSPERFQVVIWTFQAVMGGGPSKSKKGLKSQQP